MYVQLINNIYIKIKFMESLTPLKDLFLKEVIEYIDRYLAIEVLVLYLFCFEIRE